MSSKPTRRIGSTRLLPGPAYPESPYSVEVLDIHDGEGPSRTVLIEPSNGAEGVVVVAEDPEGRIAIVRQFRLVAGGYVWELPRGFGQSGDVEDDARAELLEETGAMSRSTVAIGRFDPDSGVFGGRVCAVRATVGSPLGEPVDTEEIESVTWVTRSELHAMISDGRFRDGIGLAALMLDECARRAGTSHGISSV